MNLYHRKFQKGFMNKAPVSSGSKTYMISTSIARNVKNVLDNKVLSKIKLSLHKTKASEK